MANEYLVNSADLTAVADAIRAKGGTSEALAFPGGFVEAVGAIQAGSGGDDSSLKDIIERTVVNLTLPNNLTCIGNQAFNGCTNLALTSLPEGVTSIGDCAFQGCTNLALTSLPEGVTSIGRSAFQGCTNLALTSLPEGVTIIRQSAFQGCKSLTHISIPSVKTLDNSALEGCTSLLELNLPTAESIGTYAICRCTALKKIDLHAVKTFYGSAMINNTVMDTLILRPTSYVVNTYASNILNGTAIANGSGYIYVPSVLLDSYKAATNWSVHAERFRAIEDYTIDGTVDGALDDSKI